MVLANAVGASGTLGFAGVLALGGGLRSSLVVLPFLALAAAAEPALVAPFMGALLLAWTWPPADLRHRREKSALWLIGTIAGFSALILLLSFVRPVPEKRADWAAGALSLVLGGAEGFAWKRPSRWI